MDIIGITIMLSLSLLLLALPLALSYEKKSAYFAAKEHCICYGAGMILFAKLFMGYLILLTLAAIVCTVLSIIDPQMMGVSSEDIGGIVFAWILCIVFDILSIFIYTILKRKIFYDDVSFTEFKLFRKPKKYLFSDITGIINDTKIVIYSYRSPTRRKGKLKIYFGKECVKISGLMHGISPFIEVLHEKCKRIKFN